MLMEGEEKKTENVVGGCDGKWYVEVKGKWRECGI